ncbi:hypothetical protein LXL04_016540 [Taraxacum kok-saghyz]
MQKKSDLSLSPFKKIGYFKSHAFTPTRRTLPHARTDLPCKCPKICCLLDFSTSLPAPNQLQSTPVSTPQPTEDTKKNSALMLSKFSSQTHILFLFSSIILSQEQSRRCPSFIFTSQTQVGNQKQLLSSFLYCNLRPRESSRRLMILSFLLTHSYVSLILVKSFEIEEFRKVSTAFLPSISSPFIILKQPIGEFIPPFKHFQMLTNSEGDACKMKTSSGEVGGEIRCLRTFKVCNKSTEKSKEYQFR